MQITLIEKSVLLTIKKAFPTERLHDKTMASLSSNAGVYAGYPALRYPRS